MGHDHSHHHGHHHHHTNNKTALKWSFIFIFSFMIIEAIGGLLTNSLALLSDAGHMFSDAFALGLSLFAMSIGQKGTSAAKTYGYRRFEILAAFFNGLTLLLISVYIVYEALHRFFAPPQVSPAMLYIATTGLVVNIIVAWILMKGDTKDNLNLRSAFLHVLGDLLGSVGAITAGLLIYFFNWNIADPIASMIVAVLVFVSGIRVFFASIHVLMEGKPQHISYDKLKDELQCLPGVCAVYDMHIWSITSDFPAMSCHLVVTDDIDRDKLLEETKEMLKDKFHISHSTIQVVGKQAYHIHHQDRCH
ncbi:cation diffusion facilitator family transporter [Salirhabdus salicampi]|uniref:cation diffusion facilitator family transporter n=1 Tax=Salirhabdus salicampi TaxID=476102 RepID=UPI0020C369BA|nr:cation diffusion facilitator family transporter [Salirhabdus salicampi]MCP8616031.1 cation diffusion facilitator family transporter [Salirhabdus salicampi]